MAGLPQPVEHYLERVGAIDRAPVARVTLRERGEMRLRIGGRWSPFAADQWITAEPTAFSWRARLAAGLVPLTVTDEYVDGRGRVTAGPLGMALRTVVGPEVDEGELLRWLASSVLFPTAWLQNALHWDVVGERSARVTHIASNATLTVQFENDGALTFEGDRVRTESRSRPRRRWRTRSSDLREIGGLHVPHHLEAAWIENGGAEFVYYRADIEHLELEFSRSTPVDPACPTRDVTALLAAIANGDESARDRLFAEVYHELKRLAHGQLRGEWNARTFQTTALVNEAYLRLCGPHPPRIDSRGHFFAIAARAMRQILVDHARERDARKRGGDVEKVPLLLDHPSAGYDPDLILAIDEILDELRAMSAVHAQIVDYRVFLGFTQEETAGLLGLDVRDVKSRWSFARAWILERWGGT